jgi:hypothetical protein
MTSHDGLSASTLDYASPTAPRQRDSLPGARLLTLAVSLAAALLSANAVADAAGFAPIPSDFRDGSAAGSVMLRILCGLIAGLLTFGFVRFVMIQGRAVVRAVERSGKVPGQAAAFALLGCGAVCIIVAAVTQLVAGQSAPSTGIVVQQLGVGAGRATVTVHPPLVTEVLVLLTFFVGAALVAMGVWCSFLRGGAVSRPSMMTPPAARGDGFSPPPVPASQPTAAA